MFPSSLLFFLLIIAKCQGDCLPTTPTIAESLEELELGDGLLIARLTFTQAEVVKEEEDTQPAEELVIVGDDGEPEDVFPLSVCQGDCDDDDECANDLQCFERDDLEEVAGCIGDGESGRDYCYLPPPIEEEPTTKMISTNPCSFEVYQGGEYILTDQVQAFTIQEIFHDESSSMKVGDEIALLYSTDTGYREFFLASPLNEEDGFLAVVKLVSSCYINEEYKYPYPIQEAIIQPYEMNECNFNLNVPWSSVTEEEQLLLRAIKEDETGDVEVVCLPLASVFQEGQALQSKFMNATMSSDGDMTTWKDAAMYINGEGDEVVGTQSGNCTLQLDVNGTDGEWECTIELILSTGGITFAGPSSFETTSELPIVSGFGCYDYYDKAVYNGTDINDFILQSPVGRGFKYELNGSDGSSTATDDPTETNDDSSGSSIRRALCVCIIQIVILVYY